MSLSSWFRDYVFIPLQFQVRSFGSVGLVGALVFTFVLVGMWHGAGPKYAVFGLIHGILVSYSTLTFAARTRVWRSLGVPQTGVKVVRTIVTFTVVSLTFVLFRAEDLSDAAWIYGTLVTWGEAPRQIPLAWPAALVMLLIVGDLVTAYGPKITAIPTFLRWTWYYAMSTCILVAFIGNELKSSSAVSHFIYFRF
jgi:D-alanyl-lipoteichoic acid acyltransferase DltB (MBOAT superfamily)